MSMWITIRSADVTVDDADVKTGVVIIAASDENDAGAADPSDNNNNVAADINDAVSCCHHCLRKSRGFDNAYEGGHNKKCKTAVAISYHHGQQRDKREDSNSSSICVSSVLYYTTFY